LSDPPNADGVTPGASVNDLTPQNRRTHMASIKPVEETSQDFTETHGGGAYRDGAGMLVGLLSRVTACRPSSIATAAPSSAWMRHERDGAVLYRPPSQTTVRA
jgi:hypothetical protein